MKIRECSELTFVHALLPTGIRRWKLVVGIFIIMLNHDQDVKPTKLDMPFLVIACMHVFWYQLMKFLLK